MAQKIGLGYDWWNRYREKNKNIIQIYPKLKLCINLEGNGNTKIPTKSKKTQFIFFEKQQKNAKIYS